VAKCSSCGGPLGGRFCGLCGSDNGAAASPKSVPIENGFPQIGGIFRSAWSTISRHVGDWVVTTAVAVFIAALLVGVYAVYTWLTTDTVTSGRFTYETQNRIPLIELLLGVVAIFASSYIRYGFARTALATARGYRAIVNDVWTPNRLLPMVLFDLVIGWMVLAGLVLPIVGSLFVLASCLYAPFFIIEGKGSGISAIWNSIVLTTSKGRFLRQVLFTILGLAVLGSFVGALLTMLQLVSQAGIGDWSPALRNLTLVLVGGIEFVVLMTAIIVAMTAAATAYVSFMTNDEFRDQNEVLFGFSDGGIPAPLATANSGTTTPNFAAPVAPGATPPTVATASAGSVDGNHFCEDCGTRIADSVELCSNCGAAQRMIER
jgi:hypothetical protein